jgi:hypothetical protein
LAYIFTYGEVEIVIPNPRPGIVRGVPELGESWIVIVIDLAAGFRFDVGQR